MLTEDKIENSYFFSVSEKCRLSNRVIMSMQKNCSMDHSAVIEIQCQKSIARTW